MSELKGQPQSYPPEFKVSRIQKHQSLVDEKNRSAFEKLKLSTKESLINRLLHKVKKKDYKKETMLVINHQNRDIVARDIISQRIRSREAKRAYESTIDSLTGLLNKRGLSEQLEREIKMAKRGNYPLVWLELDGNGLRELNKEKGHEAGNALLKNIAEAIKNSIRPTDSAARYGGDEYAAILANTSLAEIAAWWERAQEEFGRRGINIGVGASEITREDLREQNVMEVVHRRRSAADAAATLAKKESIANKSRVLKTQAQVPDTMLAEFYEPYG